MNADCCQAPRRPALDMRGVTVASLKNPAAIVAEDVNWTVAAGEFWVVGAPQHSGKTDFLMTRRWDCRRRRRVNIIFSANRCRSLKNRAWRIG